jgi:dimethylargininase
MIIAAEGHLTASQLEPLAEDVVWVPNRESYAANTIGYKGDRVIIADGFPVVRQTMLDEGFKITSVDMKEIMQADGSLTCLSVFNA